MAEQVKVTSIEALETFRAALIIFLGKAHRSVDEVGDEVRRTRGWLQHDQRVHWEGQVRKRRKMLDEAQQELLGARMQGLTNATTTRQAAVRKAREAVREAEEKLRLVKIWNRDFDGRADPLTRSMESLRHFLDHDMPKAISYLLQAQRTLEAYAETGSPMTAHPTASPPPEAETP